MEKVNAIKAALAAAFGLISSLLGALTVPVLLMVLCNVVDYATGLMASSYRKEGINIPFPIRTVHMAKEN